MPKRFSTARGREFGEGMRAAMMRAGFTTCQIADLLGWDQSKVSNVVTGKGGVDLLDVVAFLCVCRVKAEERERLLALFPGRDAEAWLQLYGERAPVRSRTVIDQINAADKLIIWQAHAIPVLLRTADYARELLIASATVPAKEVDERLQAQLELQELLRFGKSCTFFIHEQALRLQVGGPATHVEQVKRIGRMANRRYITVRIVPVAAGAHAGMSGPFTQLEFPKYEPLVLLENENSCLFIEAKDAVKSYGAVVRALDAVSLSEAASTALITRLYVELDDAIGPRDVAISELGKSPRPLV